MPSLVDTRKCPRRQVAYASLDEIVADAERLAAANAPTTGNWTLAQIFEHLATAMDYQVDGYPPSLQLNPVLRFMVKTLFKKRILTKGMTPGFKLRGSAATALVKQRSDVELEAALAHLRRSVARLKAADRCADHGAFGPMTKAEGELLHRQHAAMHMGFVAEP